MAEIKYNSLIDFDLVLETKLGNRADFPLQEILLLRLINHTQSKMQEYHNVKLKNLGINHTIFMAMVILNLQENLSLQPSELSLALGMSRTHVTRIIDELQKNFWIERQENIHDRRSIYLKLTPAGKHYIEGIMPAQFSLLKDLWSNFSLEEQMQYEQLMRKLLKHLDIH